MATRVLTPAMIALTKREVHVYHVIQWKEPWEAMHSLGGRVDPDWNFWKEEAYLKDKADNFVNHLLRSTLSKMDTFIFHCSTYTPTMMYSLCVTTLETQVLNDIQAKAMGAMLDKFGVNGHFPYHVAFGPKELCGMAMMDLSIEWGICQIIHFMNHSFVGGWLHHKYDYDWTLFIAAGIWMWLSPTWGSNNLDSIPDSMLDHINEGFYGSKLIEAWTYKGKETSAVLMTWLVSHGWFLTGTLLNWGWVVWYWQSADLS